MVGSRGVPVSAGRCAGSWLGDASDTSSRPLPSHERDQHVLTSVS